jgi:nitrogen fixation protein FixH
MDTKQNKFRLHWGNALALWFVFFGIFIGVLVVGSFRENIDLIEENYYEQEIKYPGRMADMQRSMNLEQQPFLDKLDNGSLALVLPYSSEVRGKAVFKRPDNAKLDFNLELKAGNNIIESSLLIGGSWIIQVEWEMDGANYFQTINHYLR